MSGFTVRPARSDDLNALGVPALVRMSAFAGVNSNGDLIGIGGVAYGPDGGKYAFSELTLEAAKSPIALHKAALRVLADAKAKGIKQLIACADLERSEAAERWLSRLGFKQHEVNGKSVWLWKA